MAKFWCPLCGEKLEIRQTKKHKPFLVCDDCGVQLFVRYERGISRLEKLSQRESFVAGQFIICQTCDVAIKKSFRKIRNPLFGKAGLYCPECEELLLEAPPGWEEGRD